jgi:DNA-binding NarL/FixJ family response regulator
MGAAPIRVAVVEDDPFQLALATRTIQSAKDLSLVGSYADGASALRAVESSPPDVLVVDLGLPDMSGSEVVRRARALADPPEVVVLTAHGERSLAIEALKAGATGYLLKGTPSDLPAAIRTAAEGGSAIAPAIARYLLDEVRVPALDAQPGATGNMPLRDIGPSAGAADTGRQPLTRREREVLALLAKGMTYEDAARQLGIGLGTVQSHVKSLYRKLEVSSKAEAAAEAVRRGIAEP